MKHKNYTHQPHSVKSGFIKLNLTVWLALLVISVAGVVATYLYHFRNPDQTKPREESTHTPKDTPIDKSNYTPDITNIIEQSKKMVSTENSFVIFEHGTCVRLLEPVKDHADAAKASLKILASPDISFIVKPLNNNNYLIVFNDYLFCWLFARDIANMKKSLLTDTRLAPSIEDPSSINEIPDFEKRLGKFARLLMLQDSKTLVIKQIIQARPQNPATP